jgi:hypothetical protein
MISRNLCRRLERIETRLMPAGEPLVIQVCFVYGAAERASRRKVTIA